MRQGQTAIEFTVLLGFMLFVFTAFFYAIQERSSIVAVQSKAAELRTVGQIMSQEITTAARVKDGYSRSFELPRAMSHGEYRIDLTENSELTIKTADDELLLFLPTNISTDTGSGPQASGRIYPGTILITKNSDGIVLRSSP